MFSFPHVDPDLDILSEKLTAQIGGWFWKTLSVHYASRVGDSMQSLSSFFNIFSGDLYFDALVIDFF